MTIPKRLKVGGATYTVSIVEKINDGEAAGRMDNQKLLIEVAQAKKEAMELTFMHELLHAINNELKETDIEFFAQALYAVIKDNPTMFKAGEGLNGK